MLVYTMPWPLWRLTLALSICASSAGGDTNAVENSDPVLQPKLLLDTATTVPDSRSGATLTSFSSPRIEDGSIVFDGETSAGRTGVFVAEHSSGSSSGFTIRAVAWSGADGGFTSLYGGSGGADTVAFIGIVPNASGIYVKSTGAAPRLAVASGAALPGMPGRIIGPAVGHGLRDMDTNANASGGMLFVSLTEQSFGVFWMENSTRSLHSNAYDITAVAVNGSTILPGCPPEHATVGAIGVAPTIGPDMLTASLYAGNGESTTTSTACEGIYIWCRHCRTELDVVADTRLHSAAPVNSGISAAKFTAFGQSSISASIDSVGAVDVGFYADSRSVTSGAIRRGVYLQPTSRSVGSIQQLESARPALQLVADTTMVCPGLTQRFTSFDAVVVHSGSVVFRAQVQGKQGIYLRDRSGMIHVIVDALTPAPPPVERGATFQYVELSPRAFDGRAIVFYGLVGAGGLVEEGRPLAQSKMGLWYVDVSNITLPSR